VELTGWQSVLESGWLNVIAFSVGAILIVVLTKGRLGFHLKQPQD
jgi:hypothetical protein